MTQNKVQIASKKVHLLDAETQGLLESVRRKNSIAIKWFVISWTILFALAVFGIYKQNQIAIKSQQHIDCIVKLFRTPLPPGANHKNIANSSSTCDIKFTK